MSAWAIETLVATTLLMLLVLAIRNPVRQAFGPHIAYALWLMPLMRMLMPPLPGEWQLSRLIEPFTRGAIEAPAVAVGVMNPATLSPELAERATSVSVDVAGMQADMALLPPSAVANGPGLLAVLLGLWAIGALGFLAYHLLSHRRYTRTLLNAARADRTVAQGKVRVIETAAAHGPLAFGVFHKYVAFPRDFTERYDEQERALALAHELGHHVRGDLIANWVALLFLALHWFNPVAWRAFRAFRADQEMACDALVLAGRAPALRHAYGRAIVKSAHGGAVSAACHLHTINEVKGRLRMLSKTHRQTPRRLAAGLIGVTAIGLTALGLTASGTQAAERIKDEVEATIGVDLRQSVPAAPAAPASPAAPAAPGAPAAPAAPKALEAPESGPHRVRIVQSSDGSGKQVSRIVVHHKDGTQNVTELPDMDELAKLQIDLPEIRSQNCGTGKPEVEHRSEGRKQITIICTDRIEMAAVNAERMAEVHKRFGLQSAMMGLRQARRSIESQSAMSASERATALAGIDEAIREVEKQRDD